MFSGARKKARSPVSMRTRAEYSRGAAGICSADAALHAGQQLLEARAVDGLQQVIECLDLEGFQGETLVGGYEHHERRHAVADRFEAVGAGHLHVEENEVGPQALDGFAGFRRARRFTGYFEIGIGQKESP